MKQNTHLQEKDYDVIVAGGGFAGVTAARDCSKNGLRTLLLEARDRLGGRTHTVNWAGRKVELGGTWIHWSQPFVWAEKERYGLKIHETPEGVDRSSDQIVVRTTRDRIVLADEQAHAVLAAFEAYFAEARKIWERPFDAGHSWGELLALDGLSAREQLDQMALPEIAHTALESLLAGIANGRSDALSYVEAARWWSLSGWSFRALDDAAGRYRLADGTASLIDAMVADGRAEIRLNSEIRAIEDRGDRVEVTLANGARVMGRSLIVCLPMNCLPHIAFTPPLDPTVMEAGRQGHVGQGLKVVVRAKRSAGPQVKKLGLGNPDCPLNICFTHVLNEEDVLFVGFGPDATRLDGNDQGEVQEAFRRFFPELELLDCISHDWSADRFSRGTWANYRAGWLGSCYHRFQQDRGRILFGQGDHGEGWRGFIDGAIGAGGKAAVRVRTLLE